MIVYRIYGFHNRLGTTHICDLNPDNYDEETIAQKINQVSDVFAENLKNKKALNFIDMKDNYVSIKINDFSYIKICKMNVL